MAEAVNVARLEQDLKRILGITTDANIPIPSQSAQNSQHPRGQKIPAHHKELHTSATKTSKVSKGKNCEPTPDQDLRDSRPVNLQKGPQKPRAHQRKEASHVEASSSKHIEKSVKGEQASANSKDGSIHEKKNNVAQRNLPRQQIPDEPTPISGFIRDRRWHPEDQRSQPTPKKDARVFNRNVASNGEEIPQNWRQPTNKKSQVPRDATRKPSNSPAEERNSTKRPSLSELAVANNEKDPSQSTTESGMKNGRHEKGKGAKAKAVEKYVKRAAVKKERDELTSRLILEYKEVPKHLLESNYPVGIVPSNPPVIPAALSKGEKDVRRPAPKDAQTHRDEIPPMTDQDGEEMVRIMVLPPPPQQKRKKEAKRENKEAPEKQEDDGSSSSSSSSCEAEKAPRASAVQQPLIFNIRRTELEIFRRMSVLPLKHISPKFPRAIFHCRLCSFHVSSIPEVYRHKKDDRHVRLQKQEMSKQTASLMPLPPPEIADVIGQFIENIYQCSGLTQEDLTIRRTATETLRNMIETAFPGFTIRPYGSGVTGL